MHEVEVGIDNRSYNEIRTVNGVIEFKDYSKQYKKPKTLHFKSDVALNVYLLSIKKIDTWEIDDLDNNRVIYKHKTLGEIETLASEQQLNRSLAKENPNGWKVQYYVQPACKQRYLSYFVLPRVNWLKTTFHKYRLTQEEAFLDEVKNQMLAKEQHVAWSGWGLSLLSLSGMSLMPSLNYPFCSQKNLQEKNESNCKLGATSNILNNGLEVLSHAVSYSTLAYVNSNLISAPSSYSLFAIAFSLLTIQPAKVKASADIAYYMTLATNTNESVYFSARPFSNDSFILGGRFFDAQGYDKGFITSKWDMNGTHLWTRELYENEDSMYDYDDGAAMDSDIEITADEGMLIAKAYYRRYEEDDYYYEDTFLDRSLDNRLQNINILAKYNRNGTFEWSKQADLASGVDVKFTSVQQTKDHGFMIVANDHNNAEYINLIKLSSVGNMEWSKTYRFESTYKYPFYKLHQTNDGGFILSAENTLSKWSLQGNLEWIKQIESPESPFVFEMIANDNTPSFMGVGRRKRMPFISKWSQDGGLEWLQEVNVTNRTGFPYTDASFNTIHQVDNGYLLEGDFLHFNESREKFLSKWLDNGTFTWTKTFDFNAHVVGQAKDAGIVFAGTTSYLSDSREFQRGFITKWNEHEHSIACNQVHTLYLTSHTIPLSVKTINVTVSPYTINFFDATSLGNIFNRDLITIQGCLNPTDRPSIQPTQSSTSKPITLALTNAPTFTSTNVRTDSSSQAPSPLSTTTTSTQSPSTSSTIRSITETSTIMGSAISTTEMGTASTTTYVPTSTKTVVDSRSIIGGAVGGSLGLLSVAGAVVGFFYYKKQQNSTTTDKTLNEVELGRTGVGTMPRQMKKKRHNRHASQRSRHSRSDHRQINTTVSVVTKSSIFAHTKPKISHDQLAVVQSKKSIGM